MGILQRSLVAGVLILVIVVVRAVFLNRLPKRAFPVLWGVVILRLLLPFAIDSSFSVYTLLHTENGGDTKIEISKKPSDGAPKVISGSTSAVIFDTTSQQASSGLQGKADRLTGLTLFKEYEKICSGVWIVGIICFAAIFGTRYYWGLREFRTALPVENAFIENWLKDKKLRRKIVVRTSDRITAPLTYGLWKPVILFPTKLINESSQRLEYVLWHEYIHIRRWHTALKILLMVAVCMHWFNPLVWVMYLLLNRDIELSCDEGVLQCLGEAARKDYANTLITMEEKRYGHSLLYSGFSKSDMEQRIRSIMKYKKTTVISIGVAVVIVLGIIIVFATSPKEKQNKEPVSKDKHIENVVSSDAEEDMPQTEPESGIESESQEEVEPSDEEPSSETELESKPSSESDEQRESEQPPPEQQQEPQITEGTQEGTFKGFVVAADGRTIIIDEQKWVQPGDEDWKDEYYIHSGFEVVDASDIHASYPLSENCKFYYLEDHWYPQVEITYKEFINYQEEHGENVLWYFEAKDGEIVEVGENYRP